MDTIRPIPLQRELADVNAWEADAARRWLMARIRQEVKLKGQPHPKILLLGDGFLETLDLDQMIKTDPAASPGATFQKLRERPFIERRFVLMQLTGEDDTGREHRSALLFEEIDDVVEGERRWWVATLPYQTDEATGTGVPAAQWQVSDGETADPSVLWPFLRDLTAPPPGARPAAVLPPRAAAPDIRVAFGELPDAAPTPADARQMVELTGQLAVDDLLAARVKGTVVVRLAGREWEMWALQGSLPTDLEDMVRYIANVREPAADGVGLAQIAIRPADEPPVPGMQVIAEHDGLFCETWAPLEFPEGPGGPKRISRIAWWDPRPVPERGMWLGIAPIVDFELGPIASVGEA